MIASGTNSASPALIRFGPGRIFAWQLFNPGNAAAYLQIFDAASVSAVTLGTTPPTMSIGVASLDGSDQSPSPISWDFVNGIVIAATATCGGSGAPNAPMVYNLNYQ